MNPDFVYALIGGLLIGAAVSFMLIFNGRVTGVSGILNGLLKPVQGEFAWRVVFVIGMMVGGIFLLNVTPEVFGAPITKSSSQTVLAGLLVGFGTLLGNGCTSGHAVCGISRLSKRSIVSTVTFIFVGIITVIIMRLLGVA